MKFKSTISSLALAAALAGQAAAGDYSTWARYRTVTVNTSAMTLSGAVTNIPVLVRFSAASHKDMLDSAATQILAGGADVRVTLSDGTTDVPFEIETATTGASGALSLWIKAPSVAQSSAAAATFRVYWGKAAQTTMSNSQSVFDTAAGYLAVLHLNETISAAGDTIRDATAGNNKAIAGVFGTGAVLPYDTAGISGVAKKINATANAVGGYFEAIDPDSSLSINTDVGPYTVSAWVNVTTCASGSRSAILTKYNNSNVASTRQFALQINSGASNWNLTNNPPTNATSGTNEFNAHTPCAINTWQHVVGTYYSPSVPTADVAGATASMKIYVNGGGSITYATANQATTTSIGRLSPLRIGALGDNQRFLRGSVDEVRMAKVVRDSNWVEVEYETQRPGATAVTIGSTLSPSVASVPDAPTGVTAVAGNAQATVSWTAPVSNGGATITGYLARATQDTTKNCAWTTGSLTCTITGLTNGTAYTFVVRATNSAGNGAFSSASASVTPSAWGAWTGRRTIVLNTSGTGANIAGTVTNFPVLVRLGAAEAAIIAAANGGNSIRFTKADSNVSLPYQIEHWSTTSAAIWVKVDSVKGNNATQFIRMYYGNGSATSLSNGPAVFDTLNGFAAVWHLGDATAQTDATGKGNTGTASTAAPLDTAGLIGRAKAFNGSTNWYQIGANNRAMNLSTGTGGITISAWVNPTSCDARIAAYAKYVNGATPAGRQYALHTGNTTTNWRFTIGPNTGADEFFADAEGTCVTGSWKQIVGTYSAGATPAADSLRIYVDGAFVASGSTAAVTGLGDSAQAYIGRIHNDQRYMNGLLDEITVASVRRDTNWIKLAYQNQKASNSLVDIGPMAPAVTVPGAPGTPTVAVGSTTGSITVTWTAPTSTGNAPITSYTATVASGTPVSTCSTSGLSCTITGLTVGSPYTFTVRATNQAGQGPASSASASISPVTGILPGAFVIRVNAAGNPYTYQLPAALVQETEALTMRINDAYGRQVWSRTINPDGNVRAITWDGKASSGLRVSEGMYVVRISARMKNGETLEAVRKGVKLSP